MNPFTLVDGKPCPLNMRGELDYTAALKNCKKWGNIEFPMPFRRVMSVAESSIHGPNEKVFKFTGLNQDMHNLILQIYSIGALHFNFGIDTQKNMQFSFFILLIFSLTPMRTTS